MSVCLQLFLVFVRISVWSPCILTVSSLSNGTTRHARLDALDTSNVSCRVETWRDVASQVECGIYLLL